MSILEKNYYSSDVGYGCNSITLKVPIFLHFVVFCTYGWQQLRTWFTKMVWAHRPFEWVIVRPTFTYEYNWHSPPFQSAIYSDLKHKANPAPGSCSASFNIIKTWNRIFGFKRSQNGYAVKESMNILSLYCRQEQVNICVTHVS